nr:MAG TPA: Endodeoxyribonuclease RusA [Caudoviricetes sp.]
MIEFTIKVVPRTKKNNGQIVMRGKYPVLLPSKQYQAFEKACMPYLNHVKETAGVINYPINMQCIFYTETKRRIDLPNLLNAIDDAAVKSGLLVDDCRDIIAGHDNSRVFHDKFNPRIEITITEIKDYTQWKDTTTEQKSLL